VKESSQLDISLPKNPVLQGASMQEMIWIIFGPPGIGKSSFVNQCPDVLFLSTDTGLRFLNVLKQDITSWFQFKKIIKTLQLDPPKRYKAIAIDTIDPLFLMCKQYVCVKRGIEHQSDEPYGKAYELTNTEFTIEMLKLTKLPYGLFFLSHAKVDTGGGRSTKTAITVPSLAGQAYKILAPMVDITAYYGFGEEAADTGDLERVMHFQPTPTIEAKDRTKGGLPESLVIPEEGGFKLVEKHLLEQAKEKPKRKILKVIKK